jgi:hypothetical protein
MSPEFDAIVIGAGPYGLSAGAHLKAAGLNVRVFGEPMGFWAHKMPEGMLLRSPRDASNLSDPKRAFTLAAYEAASGTSPVARLPRETFVRYGLWFQQHLRSDLDSTRVTAVDRENSGFRVALENGSCITARRVVVAAGIEPFQRKPPVFLNLPPEQTSHCYEGRKLAEFSGKSVAVIGAGQSALESAALLHESGAEVEVVAAIPALRWIGMHAWLHNLGPVSKMLYSEFDVGPAGISRLVASPSLVYPLPLGIKDKIRKRAVRPAGSPWLIDRLAPVKISSGRMVKTAKSINGRVWLALDDGTERTVDHVLLGTGYDVDIARYRFLCPNLVKQVRQIGGYPKLVPGFASSVPGLHFIGATAARNFGPLLYFVAGTEFASRKLTAYIRRNRKNLQ